MLKSYYCPKCQRIRQFFLEEGEDPEKCGGLIFIPVPELGTERIDRCDGLVLPVINIRGVVVGGEY